MRSWTRLLTGILAIFFEESIRHHDLGVIGTRGLKRSRCGLFMVSSVERSRGPYFPNNCICTATRVQVSVGQRAYYVLLLYCCSFRRIYSRTNKLQP